MRAAKKRIGNDSHLGSLTGIILSNPSDDLVFYRRDDEANIIMTEWGE